MSNDFNRHALINSLGVIRDHHPDLLAIGVEMARKVVSDKIRAQLSNQVAYGPFKGLRLSAQSVWSSSDSGSMLLGLYEQEVLNTLSLIAKPDRTFVNLGASDGYYGIGVLVAGLYGHSYCYESNETSRHLIEETAILNHASEKITVFGKAEKGFYNQIPSDRIDKITMLMDIEGGELDVIDKDFLKHCHLRILLSNFTRGSLISYQRFRTSLSKVRVRMMSLSSLQGTEIYHT